MHTYIYNYKKIDHIEIEINEVEVNIYMYYKFENGFRYYVCNSSNQTILIFLMKNVNQVNKRNL